LNDPKEFYNDNLTLMLFSYLENRRKKPDWSVALSLSTNVRLSNEITLGQSFKKLFIRNLAFKTNNFDRILQTKKIVFPASQGI
jgi:hypothetical protein